jgi:hypothetical protein
MSSFLYWLIAPVALATLVGLIALRVQGWALAKKAFFSQWRVQAAVGLGLTIAFLQVNGLKGAALSALLCMLLDDDMRKKGRKAAKLIGNKTRLVLEEMSERMRPREVLPGLSSA